MASVWKWSLHSYLKHLWTRRTNPLVPIRISESDFPEGVYDPHYDFVRLFVRDVERGAALSMVSAFEIALTKAIRSSIAGDDKLHEEMFREGGVLGSLATKVRIGFLVKMYSRETMGDLERISKIRNLFAHVIDAHDFSYQRVRGLTEAISLLSRAENSSDHLVRAVRDKVVSHLDNKDLTKAYFKFFGEVAFATAYFAAREEIRSKHGPEVLERYGTL